MSDTKTICTICGSDAHETGVDKDGIIHYTGDCGTEWWGYDDTDQSDACIIIDRQRTLLRKIREEVVDVLIGAVNHVQQHPHGTYIMDKDDYERLEPLLKRVGHGGDLA